MSEENKISIKLEAETDEMQGAMKDAGEQIQDVNKGLIESFNEMSERIKECIDKITEKTNSGAQNAGNHAGKLVTTV